jgi:ABC-type sugar transport system ATPase subunit
MASNPDQEPVVRVHDVTKAWGATQALAGASLDLLPGEVHCVVGENGSGKSTLVKLLAGIHLPDSGRLTIGDDDRGGFGSPRAALDAGICTVFQEVLVVESRSVFDNVWLGADRTVAVRTPTADRRRTAADLLAELLRDPPALDAPVETLSLSDRQACAIVRALLRRPRVLILDESTSALDVETRDRLFAIVGRLTAEGMAVLFISHRMDEIAAIGDRCTVLRSGETVATLGREQANATALVRLMTGEDHLVPPEADRDARRSPGDEVLRADGLVLRPGARPIDFTLRRGEIVGLAGLEGQGQDAFIKALWGIGSHGSVFRGDVEITSPRGAAGVGIAYVPRERRAESIFPSMSIRENFAMPTLARDAARGLVRPSRSRARLADWTDALSIRLGRSEDPITTLSGGNQQKVIVARWLATDPSVLLLNDPTRGVDIAAKRDLYRLLVGLVDEGLSIVILSTEVDEHVELMDRVLVFREDAVFAELARADVTPGSLVAAYFGRPSARAEVTHA